MRKTMLPPHIEKICHDWHYGDESEMMRLATYQEFDAPSVVREIERRRTEVRQSDREEEKKEEFYAELNKLKRYVINLVVREIQYEND